MKYIPIYVLSETQLAINMSAVSIIQYVYMTVYL